MVGVLVENKTVDLKWVKGEVLHNGLKDVAINNIPSKREIHFPFSRIRDFAILDFLLVTVGQFLGSCMVWWNESGWIDPLRACEGREDFCIVMGRSRDLGDGGRIFDCHGGFQRGHFVLGLREDGGRTER